MDMENELQEVEEQDEHHGMHHHRRYTRPLVGELHGAFLAGDLQQQARRQDHEQDDTDDRSQWSRLPILQATLSKDFSFRSKPKFWAVDGTW